jgi:hypothetical protein
MKFFSVFVFVLLILNQIFLVLVFVFVTKISLHRVRTPHYFLKGDEFFSKGGSEKLLKVIKVIYSASIYAESSNSRTNTALACTRYDSVDTLQKFDVHKRGIMATGEIMIPNEAKTWAGEVGSHPTPYSSMISTSDCHQSLAKNYRLERIGEGDDLHVTIGENCYVSQSTMGTICRMRPAKCNLKLISADGEM